ncbi:unnamed protein product [Brugia pahangi]|uniref:Secreted protein n=1 Tax=Brugia pahangi TaxID=6280 RepID=A0A0N4TC88_BRUPA|nr:unnamed protein product [Brugia pahangi]
MVTFSIVTFSLIWIAFSVHADFQKIKFKNCKSVFNITNVEVNGCVGSPQRHCAFRRGTTPHLRIEFIPSKSSFFFFYQSDQFLAYKFLMDKVKFNLTTAFQ